MLEDFLDWESRREQKYESDGLRPVAMTGVRVAHSTIQADHLAALEHCLRGGRCRVRGSGLKI